MVNVSIFYVNYNNKSSDQWHFCVIFSRYRSPDSKIEEEALKENEEALARLSQNPTQKPNHVSVNAAAGLIIMNNRPPQNTLSKVASQRSTSPTNNGNSVSKNAVSTISSVSPQQQIPSLFSVSFMLTFKKRIRGFNGESYKIIMEWG